MNDIKQMFKLALIIHKGSSYSGGNNSGLKKNKNKWMYFVLPLCFLPMLASMIMMVTSGFNTLASAGDEHLIIDTYLTISTILTLFMGFFYAISILFFSTDNELLAHLPIKSWTVCGARFIVILAYEYLFEAFVFIPTMLTYGIMSGEGILFYIYALIILFILPILPVGLLSIFSMLLVRYIPLFKSKDKINYFTTLLSIIIVLTVYLPFMSSMNTESEDTSFLFYNIAGGEGSVASTLSRILPSLGAAFRALRYSGELSGLLHLLFSVVISLVGFVLFMAVASLIYSQALGSISESSSSRKKLTREELKARSAKSSALKALTLKEIRLLFRSPVYFMNCVISAVLFPVIFVIAFIAASDFETVVTDIQNFFAAQANTYLPIVLAGASFIAMFIISTGSITSTSISREGKQITFSKMLPVDKYTQLKAKLLSAVILTSIPLSVITFVVLNVLSAGIVNTSIITASVFLSTVFTASAGLLVDMGRPKLLWDNEQAAVKQNVNGMLGMLITMPIVFIVSVPSIIITFVFQINVILSVLLHIALSILVSLILIKIIKKRADKCYDNIEL